MPVIVTVDLRDASNDAELLAIIGEALQLGGPDGNNSVIPASTIGWGMNWDALADSLSCLDTGGIWGTSKRLGFPLSLRFEGARRLSLESPRTLGTLLEVLQLTKQKYANSGLDFDFLLDTSVTGDA